MVETKHLAREDMLVRVSRSSERVGFSTGYPDADLPGCKRTLYSVIGFTRVGQTKDLSENAAEQIVWGSGATSIAGEGFSLGFGESTPGNGQILHNHDTNETFVVMSGLWGFRWNAEEDEYIELGPLDVISFPAGVPRRFTNIASDSGDPNEKSLLLAVVCGNSPETITEPYVLAEAKATGAHTPVADRAVQQG